LLHPLPSFSSTLEVAPFPFHLFIFTLAPRPFLSPRVPSAFTAAPLPVLSPHFNAALSLLSSLLPLPRPPHSYRFSLTVATVVLHFLRIYSSAPTHSSTQFSLRLHSCPPPPSTSRPPPFPVPCYFAAPPSLFSLHLWSCPRSLFTPFPIYPVFPLDIAAL
jgi:hypothetical protein